MPISTRNFRNLFGIGQSTVVSGSRTNLALSGAYSHLVSGPGYAVQFRAMASGPLQEVYLLNDATTGTRANVSLAGNLYEGSQAASNLRPSSTLVATATPATLPATDDRWIRWTFPTPPTLTVNTVYWFIVSNASAAPTVDFCGILSNPNFRSMWGNLDNFQYVRGVTTANGYSTNGTSAVASVVIVIDGQPYGNPFTITVSPYTSNTLRHGALFHNDVKYFRHYAAVADALTGPTTGHNVIEIQDATQPPGSGVQFTDTITPFDNVTSIGIRTFPNPVVLTGNNDFIVSFRSVGSSTTPGGLRIEGYSDYPTVFDQFFDGWTSPRAVQEVGGVWVPINDTVGRISLIPDRMEIPSGGGGGLFLPLGFDGGIDG